GPREIDAVRARDRAQEHLVVALALDQVARELAPHGAVLDRQLGVREELVLVALHPLAQAVALGTGAHVGVEREVSRLEGALDLEAALGTGAARAVLAARAAAAGDHADPSARERLGVLDRLGDARAGLALQVQAVEHQVDPRALAELRQLAVQALLDA